MILDNIDFTKKGVLELLVTPDMARSILDNRNNVNRNFRPAVFAKYLNDMVSGKWYTTEQSRAIGFFECGNLSDGQHRMHLIVATGQPMSMRVEFGIPKDHSYGIDGHIPRSNADQIKIAGGNDWISKDHISIVRLLHVISGNKSATAQDVAADCNKLKSELDQVIALFSTKQKGITTAPVMASVMLALREEKYDRVAEFVSVLQNGLANGKEDFAAIRARDFLITKQSGVSGSSVREITMKTTMRAIKAFCDRQSISKLYTPKDFIYEVSL